MGGAASPLPACANHGQRGRCPSRVASETAEQHSQRISQCETGRRTIQQTRISIFFSNAPCTGKRFLVYYAAFSTHGEVAQLVEHHVRNVGVESSNLFFSTIQKAFHPEIKGEAFFCWRKWLNGFIKLNSSLLYVDMLDIGQCGFFGVL